MSSELDERNKNFLLFRCWIPDDELIEISFSECFAQCFAKKWKQILNLIGVRR